MSSPPTANLNLNLTTLCRGGQLKEALHILVTVRNLAVNPSTYAQLLKACISKNAVSQGKKIHSHITQMGFSFARGTYFQNNLINMYFKCDNLVKARKVFDEMPERDVVSWNIIISGNVRHGFSQNALTLFNQMQRAGVQPDQFTLRAYSPACAKIRGLEQGMDIHQSVVEKGFLADAVAVSALVDMYAKCGSIDKARELFDKIPQRDVVSWNGMIAGYAQSGVVVMALEMFKEMLSASVKPDSTTFSSVLLACAKMGAVEQGVLVHQKIIENGYLSDVIVASALVDMYAKCGSMDRARELFEKMSERDVIAWTAMIVGYAQNGLVEKALKFLSKCN